MPRILITGAGGFIGRNLADYLSTRGYFVAGGDLPDKALNGQLGVNPVDILNEETLRLWIEAVKPEVVFHLGARTDLLGRTLSDYVANIAGVENLIRVCSQVSSIKRVVFASSRMVCRIDHVPVSYDEYSPPNFYGESKVHGERLVKTADAPFEWVIVRPTSIWGPGFGIPYRNFFDQVHKRRYANPGNHRPKKSFGYVENTIFQLERLLTAPTEQVNRKTFYLGDYEPLDVAAWAECIHRAFGLPGGIRTIPMPVLKLIAKSGDFMNMATGKDQAPLTTFRLNNLITNMVYPQLAELRAVTGDLPFDWRQGTERTVAWLKQSAPAR